MAEHKAQRKKRHLSICLEAGFRPPLSQVYVLGAQMFQSTPCWNWDTPKAGWFLLMENQSING